MNLNYIAFGFISFIPIILGWIWFSKSNPISKISGYSSMEDVRFNPKKVLWLFLMSIAFVYAYMNLIIHQLGFYELFFTDIMKGDLESQKVVDDFMTTYGRKHRHFGHGVLHGVINAFIFCLPIVSVQMILGNRSRKYFFHYFSYWLITSAIIGGLISQFI